MHYFVVDVILLYVYFSVSYAHIACALMFVLRCLEVCVAPVLVMSLGAKVWPPEAQAGGSFVLV